MASRSPAADHASELSSISSALDDLLGRITGIARGLERVEGGEAVAAELLAIDSTLMSGSRRLAVLLRRI